MTYREFKQAAKKHYKTSKCLYERCDKDDWQIQENIFYLCGYVIEMMIKYQIYRRINHPIDKDIRQIDKSTGLTYSNHINKHNINILVRTLEKYENIALFKDIKEVFKNWDVAVRYNGKRKHYTNLEEFLELSKKLIEKFEG